MHDPSFRVSHQHPFQRTVEHRSSQSQLIVIVLMTRYLCLAGDDFHQTVTRDKEHDCAYQHPSIAARALPDGQMSRIFDEKWQQAVERQQPQNGQHAVQNGRP